MLKLQVIHVSTREGRAGLPVSSWFTEFAKQNGTFDVEFVDLAEINLPLLDEPNHPMMENYQHEHTKAWSKIVARADAYVFVTSEYNYATPPSLVNAIDYLSHEWAYKPAGFVSYGGISGGSRSVQSAKQFLTSVGLMPLPQAVHIPFFAKQINDQLVFEPVEAQEQGGATMLAELQKWAEALKPLHYPPVTK
jgi:NAD(P)H-dependent FMN reductase